jgi:hypothetical protein
MGLSNSFRDQSSGQVVRPPSRRPNRRPGNRHPAGPAGRPGAITGGPRDHPNQPSSLENTDVGTVLINENPDDYYRSILSQNGIRGASAFDQWMQTTGADLTMDDYFTALRTGSGKTNFKAFMDGPTNTGNAYTSSSTPTLNFNQWRGQEAGVGPNKFAGMQNNRQAALRKKYQTWRQGQQMLAGPVTPANRLEALRQQYLQLTPEQSGQYSRGYGLRPGRFSVYG